MTPFPQIQMITHLKEPYDRLWHTAINFLGKHEIWMNGMSDWGGGGDRHFKPATPNEEPTGRLY